MDLLSRSGLYRTAYAENESGASLSRPELARLPSLPRVTGREGISALTSTLGSVYRSIGAHRFCDKNLRFRRTPPRKQNGRLVSVPSESLVGDIGSTHAKAKTTYPGTVGVFVGELTGILGRPAL